MLIGVLTTIVVFYLIPLLLGHNLLVYAITRPFVVVIALGVVLLLHGLRTVKLKGLYCIQCRYQFAPDGDNPDQCPECGAFWKVLGGVRERRKLRYPKLIMVGVITFVFGVLGAFIASKNKDRLLALVPTESLIDQVTGSGKTSWQEWKVLNARTLTEEERLSLARGIVAQCRGVNRCSMLSIQWMWVQVGAGTLPEEIREAFFEHAFDAELVGPESAYVGQMIDIEVKFDSANSVRFSVLPPGESVRFRWYNPELRFLKGGSGPNIRLSTYKFQGWATEPGTYTVRLPYWFAYGSKSALGQGHPWKISQPYDLSVPPGVKVAHQGVLKLDIEITPQPERAP
jgi:hypothetical protein